VQIKIFPNRIEVSSPGGLFGPMTEEDLGLEWPVTYYWIKKLIKEELLERTTGPARSPSVKYRLKA